MLVLKDVLAHLVIRDQLGQLVNKEMLDLLVQLELKDFKGHVVLKENQDLKDCPDLKGQPAQLVLLVKREAEVCVENLVNLAKEEKLEVPV